MNSSVSGIASAHLSQTGYNLCETSGPKTVLHMCRLDSGWPCFLHPGGIQLRVGPKPSRAEVLISLCVGRCVQFCVWTRHIHLPTSSDRVYIMLFMGWCTLGYSITALFSGHHICPTQKCRCLPSALRSRQWVNRTEVEAPNWAIGKQWTSSVNCDKSTGQIGHGRKGAISQI